MISWTTRLALELIGQSGLGRSFDDLTEGSMPHPYALAAKTLTFVHLLTLCTRTLTEDHRSTFTPTAFQQNILMPFIARLGTPRFRRFLVENCPLKLVTDIKALIDVFHNTSVEIYKSKKRALQEGSEELTSHIGQGKDLIRILSTSIRLSSHQILTEILQ